MLAQRVVRAENSGMVAEGVVFSEKPVPDQGLLQGQPKWKQAFHQLLWSKQLSLPLRGALLTLLRLSDPLGRVWWSQSSLAKKFGCCARTIRRLLHVLVERGYLRREAQTFASLTEEQRALGLPAPERNDEGRAPSVLTLLVDGELACKLDGPKRSSAKRSSKRTDEQGGQDKPRPGVARTAPHGQVVQGGPRTKVLEIPSDKNADDLSGSTLLNRKVEGDQERAPDSSSNGDGEGMADDVEPADEPPRGPDTSQVPSKHEAWQALDAAYDAHYRRTYGTRPLNKLVSPDVREALATCLVESAEAFEASLRARGVDAKTFEIKPCALLVNEALRTWFDTPGGNNYLRRVSHPLGALRQDLPYHLRKATKTQLELHTPKPEPRRALESSTALVPTLNAEEVSPDNPRPMRHRSFGSLGICHDFVAMGARKIVEALTLPIMGVHRPRFG
jgi:Helix-turn-helix domain